jgi:hypothetical protein
MRAGLIGAILLVVLVGGIAMGIAALLLLPLLGGVLLVVLLIWMLRRRSEGKPPIR